jgi:pyruvate formate lyase activating enzyme
MGNFYKKYSDNRVVCTLCQHYCKIRPQKEGICGVNRNVGDRIECLVYGYPSAIALDPIEKKPLYHFLPNTKAFSIGTVGCNFRCPFCQNWTISQTAKIDKSRYFSPNEIVKLAKEYNSSTIAYTYNEPTIFYPYARDIALLAQKDGIKNIFVTNGYESKEVILDMRGVIDGANIDLKSFNPIYYRRELGANLDKLLESIKLFKEVGIWIEITTLIIPTKNDTPNELREIANFIANELGREVPWHISAFSPNYKEKNLPRTSYERLKMAYEIGKEAGLYYIYIGNVNFDNETRCPKCKAKLITRGFFSVKENNLIDGKCKL